MAVQMTFAQKRTLTGTVRDKETKEPMPGVTILEKGTTNGTITDASGAFKISVAPKAVISATFIGMKPKDIIPGDSPTLVIELEQMVQSIEEVVVVGYGTQKKVNLTGAVSTVDVQKNLEARPITDVGRALQGTTPGLIVTTTSGALGGNPTIRIRGMVGSINSLGASSPLILVDQVEVPSLSYVNPDDIESISVLKDAATTAIYGARAAFGAVLITTKSGRKDGKVKVSYSNNFSWAKPTNVPKHTRADLNLQYSYDQLNALKTTPQWEYGQVGYWYNPDVIAKVKNWIDTYGDGKALGREMVEGRDFDYRKDPTTGKPLSGAYYYRPWDIFDIYYKNWTPQQNHNISINGGNEKTQYTLTAGSLKQEGILNLFDDFYKKLNTMVFVSSEVNKWMTVRGRFIHTKETQETPFSYTGTTYDPMYYLYRWHNVMPCGTYNGNEFRGGVAEMKAARPIENDAYFNRFTLGTTLKLTKGLTADFDYTSGQTFATNHTVGGYVKGIDLWNLAAGQKFDDVTKVYTSASYDYIQYTSSKNLRNTYNGYLTYENKFGDHSFKAMVGTNLEDAEYIYQSAKRNNVYNFDLPEVNLAGGDQAAGSSHSWWSIAGFFGRLNYAYKDKYLLEVDARYDGVSKFQSGRRWGFYPSASAGWRITEEPWMKPLLPVISSMKLRASYGENGNQDVPTAAYYPTLSVTNPTIAGNYWLINSNFVPYILNAAALVDPSLTWETVRTTDIGLDSRFLDNTLGATIEWYQRKTLDVISPGEVVPSTVGATAAVRNFGELTTKGIELSIDYTHTFSNGLHMTLTGQFSDYKSIVTQYKAANDPLTSTTYYKNKVLGDIWGYKTVGLFQKEDFVWENGAIKQTVQPDGQPRNTMAEGVPNQYILESGLFKFSPGDVRFKDLNGDGVINYGTNTVGNPGDRTVIGNSQPRYQYGFRIDADWKGFDVSFFFQGVGKRNIWATGNMVLPGYYGSEANFAHTLDYWTPQNPGAFYPRPMEYSQTAKWNYLPNDRYLLNVAYFRLKNLSFGYTFPQKLVSKVNIQKLRVYFNGENLFEFDKLGNIPIDPEIDWTSTTANDSRSFGRSYPYRRSLSMGIQLEF